MCFRTLGNGHSFKKMPICISYQRVVLRPLCKSPQNRASERRSCWIEVQLLKGQRKRRENNLLCKDKVERRGAVEETAAPRRWAENRRRMWAVLLTPAAGREGAKSGLLSTKVSRQQGLYI